ncbi:1,6-anhydro-N-acetylmuramyl-L-alanine amidase AmpD [Vibrio spartinae]|uniref:1,6-anhydro-N-acetylmuramyl-L-alanine amidase AmpD n=1 Tax=Vibrio spartinae TaxID=1918945 RepID=A0ABX6QW34_9VIBR|nr:1,6-anhydro-N-acetylmuramyl-L-alanine amidase AmpD [Vibrio spartinae]QMV13328.1 1,6-anhydro-N-acetylmuramyl-L-alanine amidase AmpD [Vibrio spartinae]
MIDPNGWYDKAQQVISPFYDQRESPEDISLLVIHNISLPPGQFGGPYIEQLFQGKLQAEQHPFFQVVADFRVSAHCLIRRDGHVIQFVSFLDRAWHAGVSSFAGRARCNDYSIGIELEGTELTAYTDAQYQSLATLTQAILARYPQISQQRITGHQYIAPLRKTDPGLTFDWRRYRHMLKNNVNDMLR